MEETSNNRISQFHLTSTIAPAVDMMYIVCLVMIICFLRFYNLATFTVNS